MVIKKSITQFVVFSEDSLSFAFQKISNNQSGFVLIVDQNGVLYGVLTDGDIRRWLVNTPSWDLSQSVKVACNRNFIFANENGDSNSVESMFSNSINFVPIIDIKGRLTAVALNKEKVFTLGTYVVSDDRPSLIIAEIGNNHNGDINLAKLLVEKALVSGANCVKFQMRQMSSMYREIQLDKGSRSDEDLGAEYTLDLLSRFQLSNDELFEVFDYCKSLGILPLCTPFDEMSLDLLEAYGMDGYKLASADLTNHDLIKKLAATHKPLICSTGMSSESEIIAATNLLRECGSSFVLLHCNSTYPAPFKDINLNYLSQLRKIAGDRVVGYSGHERGYSVAIAAVAKGARIIEKHFTIDRGMEGNDHKVSLLPDEFSEMVRAIREVEEALGSADIRRITQGELMNREVLAKSLIAARTINKGHTITGQDIDVKSPGRGLPPYLQGELIGKIAVRDFEPGDFFYEQDIQQVVLGARDYNFKRPFGVPVRYHDLGQVVGLSNFDLVEFHLSYKDMELDPDQFLDANGYDLDFVVHSPELFARDHIMDLCSEDEEYRSRSISELQKVINLTRSLKKYFKTNRPCIIINAGGATQNEPLDKAYRPLKYEMIADAILQLDTEGVEIIPQTMPPFPWHFGGQRFHNLFMDSEEISEFCLKNDMRVCLDISHSKLYCNKELLSFGDFIRTVAPFVAHLHIADAIGVDGEGLQIHEGEIDFELVGKELEEFCPNASFIPEIWQGHKNDFAGFWLALERLERYL